MQEKLLVRLNIDIDAWLLQSQYFEREYQALLAKHKQRPKRAA